MVGFPWFGLTYSNAGPASLQDDYGRHGVDLVFSLSSQLVWRGSLTHMTMHTYPAKQALWN